MLPEKTPTLTFTEHNQGKAFVEGAWLVHIISVRQVMDALKAQLTQASLQTNLEWDLTQISALDHIGAQMLWQAWGKKRPAKLTLNSAHESLFERLEQVSKLAIPIVPKARLTRVMRLGSLMLGFFAHLFDFVILLGQLILDIARFIRYPMKGPWKELSANVYRTGFQALGITALVGMLIGVVLSYLFAQHPWVFLFPNLFLFASELLDLLD